MVFKSAIFKLFQDFASVFVNLSAVDFLIVALKLVVLSTVDWRHCLLELGASSVLAATCLALRW